MRWSLSRCLTALGHASIILAALIGALSIVFGLVGLAFNGASTTLELWSHSLKARKREGDA